MKKDETRLFGTPKKADVSKKQSLEMQLQKALREEDYMLAAVLRDQLLSLSA